MKIKYNLLSVISLVIAIITLFFLQPLSILAIILGFMSLNQIKKKNEKGKWLAILAIVLGFINLIYGLLIISGILGSLGIFSPKVV